MSVPSHRPHRSLFRPIPGILMSVAAAIGFATSGVHGELTEIPPSEFARFGTEVASDGASFLAAAAMRGSIGGRVQVFRGSPSAAWSLFDTLEASDSSFDDQFGLSIATYKGTSDLDPYLFAIGAPGHSERRGAVYIFAISGLEFVEVAKIMSPFPEASAAFGYQTALSPDGKYLAVTAPRDRLGCPSCGQGLGPGNVYIYKRHPKLGWVFSSEISTIVPINYFAEEIGASLAFVPGLDPSDPPELLVGASGARDANEVRNGAVYVLRELTPGTWSRTHTLAAPLDGGGNQGFGRSLAVSPNGTKLCVGAPTSTFSPIGSPPSPPVGSAYLLTRLAGVWSNSTRLLPLGSSETFLMGDDVRFLNNEILAVLSNPTTVTLYRGTAAYEELRDPTYVQGAATTRHIQSIACLNETIACGVPFAAPGGQQLAGSVLLFDAGVGKFGAADPAPFANFGAAVAAFNQIAVIGQPGANPGELPGHDTGLVEFFQRSATTGTWKRIASVPSPLPTGAPATPFHRFGASVAYPVANRVVVGAPEWSAGSGAAVLQHCGAVTLLLGNSTGTTWDQGTQLSYPLNSPPQAGELVGSAIAAVKSGSFLFIAAGAPDYNEAGPQSGRVHIWRGPIGGNASQFVRIQTLEAAVPQAGARFGAAVAMEAYSDGSIDLWAGAPGEDIPRIIPGTFFTDVGSIYLYRKSGLSSSFVAVNNGVRHPGLGLESQYGSALSLKNGKLAVGAPLADNGSVPESGRVYGWRRVSGLWSQLANPFTGTLPGGQLGAAVATNGSSVLAGEPGATLNGLVPSSGRVRTLNFTSTGFSNVGTTTYADARPFDAFGSAVAFGNGTGSLPSVIGSPSNDNGDINSAGMAFGFATPLDPCVADVDGDFAVGPTDLALVIAEWGPQELGRSSADVSDDGNVDGIDLAMVLTYWESCSDE